MPPSLAFASSTALAIELVHGARDPIAQRDLESGEKLVEEEIALLQDLVGPLSASSSGERRISLNQELARRVRRGDVPNGTLQTLRRIAELKLRTASPRYLERRR